MKRCLFCNEYFKSRSFEKFCHMGCKECYSIKKANEEWVRRETINPSPNLYCSDILKRHHVAKRPTTWMQKFNAVRG